MKDFSKTKLKLIVILPALLILYSCKPDITITKTFIYNSNWGSSITDPTDFTIARLNNKDSILQYDSIRSGFDIYNLLKQKKIAIDSSFIFYIKPNSGDKVKKVYFDREQDSIFFGKWTDVTDIDYKKIGNLKNDSWYEFRNVYNSLSIYSYVDENGVAHTWMIEAGAW